MAKSSNQDILLEELRIIQEEMKRANISLSSVKTTLESVKDQTERTNGRVTKLEEVTNYHRGGLAIAYIIIAIVVIPLIVAFAK